MIGVTGAVFTLSPLKIRFVHILTLNKLFSPNNDIQYAAFIGKLGSSKLLHLNSSS